MAITRYRSRLGLDPWAEFDELRSRLTSLMRGQGTLDDGTGFGWAPAIELTEKADELILTAEMPGVEEEDVDVHIENNTLSVRGEKKREHEEKTDQQHVWEREYGSFERRIPLPRSIAEDKVNAEFENGVLTVRMPKREESKGRRIQVKGK